MVSKITRHSAARQRRGGHLHEILHIGSRDLLGEETCEVFLVDCNNVQLLPSDLLNRQLDIGSAVVPRAIEIKVMRAGLLLSVEECLGAGLTDIDEADLEMVSAEFKLGPH